MGILWTIIIGFIAGVIAKFIMPGDKEPSGFIMTTILGSWALSLHRISDEPSAGTTRVKVQGLSARSSGRSSSCSCMASSRAGERLERRVHVGRCRIVETSPPVTPVSIRWSFTLP